MKIQRRAAGTAIGSLLIAMAAGIALMVAPRLPMVEYWLPTIALGSLFLSVHSMGVLVGWGAATKGTKVETLDK